MNRNQTLPVPRTARKACERITQRLDDLAERNRGPAYAARTAAILRILFGDVDTEAGAVEKSGAVKVPE